MQRCWGLVAEDACGVFNARVHGWWALGPWGVEGNAAMKLVGGSVAV